MNPKNKNYYEILELTPDATRQEIDAAYRAAKETYSTSNSALYSMFDEDEALELHQLIEESYSVLTQPDLKKEYDSKNTPMQTSIAKSSPSLSEPAPADELYLKNGVIMKPYTKDPEIEKKIKSLEDCTGNFLQKIRKYKNITIQELSDFSRISKTNIIYIEQEDFDNLPPKVFTRGFAQQLSRLLGLDQNVFASGYTKLYDEKN